MNNMLSRNMLIWLILALGALMLFSPGQETKQPSISYSELMDRVDQGQVSSVIIQGNELTAIDGNGGKTYSIAPKDPSMLSHLLGKNIEVRAEPPEDQPWYMAMLMSAVPMLILLVIWVYAMRNMSGMGGGRMSIGRSRHRVLSEKDARQRVTFADVAGVDEAKDELREIVEFLSNPKKFTRLGCRIPKGCLLVGPPGTGKTLLARAVAGEAGVPFFSISGSDFVEMFVGVGASRVRDLFEQSKKNAPCIIFVDEIDAVGRRRGAGLGGGHDEREQTLNQLLVEMDGFEANEGVIILAATNRPDVLDPALLRPGRFDRQVVVPTPDLKGRKEILKVHTGKIPLGNDINLDTLASGTPGFSGADLENLVNEASLQAARSNKKVVTMQEFEYAKDKILMGRERKSLILSEEEKKITAYHEAGHALAARLLPDSDPVHKVSIIPRGRALGVTMQLPGEDRHNYVRSWLRNNLVILLGGRVAEEIIFKNVTTGASNDIERVTKMARRMVCEWGMSEKMGTVLIGEKNQEVFIGREWVQNRNYSEKTARAVDAEVKSLVNEAHQRCRTLLTDNLAILHRIAKALIEKETITGEDIDALMAEPDPVPPAPQGAETAVA